jgi:patatin-like phospholipase/acyl hydrolase
MNKKVRILSLDGGGIRGIIPATVLKYVEKTLMEKTNNPNARIADYFDMIVGTSTGGILGCFYLTPNPTSGPGNPSAKYTAAQALEFYSVKGKNIFTDAKRHGWFGLRQLLDAAKFSPENIERIFLEEFGDLKMDALLKPCIVTSYDMVSQCATFFSSRETPEKKRDYLVRDVVRSTSAAPTYFPPAFIKNLATSAELIAIDGGVFANNPSICAYAEARTTVFKQVTNPSAKDMLVLSIGTGGGQLDYGKIQKSGSWGVTDWAKTIPEIMMDGSLDTVDYQMQRLFATLEGDNKLNYKRVNVPTDKRLYDSDMSNASDKNIQDLIKAGEAAVTHAKSAGDGHTLDAFVDLLIANEP